MEDSMALGWWIAGTAGVVWIGSLLVRRTVAMPPGDDDGTLVRLMESGNRIEAIRRYRSRHGGGLKEAKEAVERLARGEAVILADPPTVPTVSGEIEALVREGRHIEAIKAYREAHPEVDLALAKERVEQLGARLAR